MMGKKISVLVAVMGIAALILDTETAVNGAKGGIELCIATVIPSMFPFFILSGVITSSIPRRNVPAFSILCRLLKIPDHGLPLLLIGLLGGYPIGAKTVSHARAKGLLDLETARRMSIICNQAGPSFLFGMVASSFTMKWTGWLLWLIIILSAVLTGLLMPGQHCQCAAPQKVSSLSFPEAMTGALRAMANVCGWVILFRVAISMLFKWVLWILPIPWQITSCGLLEMANGCIMLRQVSNIGLRFVLAAVFLSFGGCCVMLQTASVFERTGIRIYDYFPGKCLQCAIATALAVIGQFFLPVEDQMTARDFSLILPIFLVFLAIYSIHVYNGQKHTNRRWHLCFSERKSPVPANIVNLQR